MARYEASDPLAGAAAALLVLVLAVGARPVAAQTVASTCADLRSLRDYLIENPDIQQAGLSIGVDELGKIEMAIAQICGGQPGEAVRSPNPTSSNPAIAPPAPDFDITQCLVTDDIEALLGKPTKFHAGGDARQARFIGPSGATLQLERASTDGATEYQQRLDAALAHPGWLLASQDGLGDKAFAVDRGGDSRSLVVLQGDTAWLVHMDGVPANSGYPQMAKITKNMLAACP